MMAKKGLYKKDIYKPELFMRIARRLGEVI